MIVKTSDGGVVVEVCSGAVSVDMGGAVAIDADGGGAVNVQTGGGSERSGRMAGRRSSFSETKLSRDLRTRPRCAC